MKCVWVHTAEYSVRTGLIKGHFLYHTTFTGEGVEDSGDEHITNHDWFADVPAIPSPITHVFHLICTDTAPPQKA